MKSGETKLLFVGSEGKPGEVGQNLLRLMDERDLGVNELARKANMPPQRITELTSGRSRDARVETAKALAEALEVDIDDLTLKKEEFTESEKILRAFEASEECRRLTPPYGASDARRLRGRRAKIVRSRLPQRAIRFLVRQERWAHHEQDFTE